MRKDLYLQKIRGGAIIAVLIIHTFWHGTLYIRPLVSWAVGAFLFLSGYLTDAAAIDFHDKDSILCFWRKRIGRVLLPYILWSGVYAFLQGFTAKQYIAGLVTAQCCGIFYYFFLYMQLVFITPVIIQIDRKCQWINWTVTPVALIILYINALMGNTIESPWNGIFFPVLFVYYYVGLKLKNDKELGGRIKIKWIIGIIVICFFLEYAESIAWSYGDNYTMAVTQVKGSAIAKGVLLMVLLIKKKGKQKQNNLFGRLLIVLGNDSFAIYLTHLLLLDVCGLSKVIHLYEFDFISGLALDTITFLLCLSLEVAVIEISRKLIYKFIKRDKLSRFIRLCAGLS